MKLYKENNESDRLKGTDDRWLTRRFIVPESRWIDDPGICLKRILVDGHAKIFHIVGFPILKVLITNNEIRGDSRIGINISHLEAAFDAFKSFMGFLSRKFQDGLDFVIGDFFSHKLTPGNCAELQRYHGILPNLRSLSKLA